MGRSWARATSATEMIPRTARARSRPHRGNCRSSMSGGDLEKNETNPIQSFTLGASLHQHYGGRNGKGLPRNVKSWHFARAESIGRMSDCGGGSPVVRSQAIRPDRTSCSRPTPLFAIAAAPRGSMKAYDARPPRRLLLSRVVRRTNVSYRPGAGAVELHYRILVDECEVRHAGRQRKQAACG